MFELLDGFHDVIASLIVLLDILLNTLQRLAEFAGLLDAPTSKTSSSSSVTLLL